MYCGEASLVKHHPDHRHARRLKCRSWRCPDCQPDRSKRLVAEGFGGRPTTFLTLTIIDSYDPDPIKRCKALVRAWRLVRLRIMRLKKLKRLPFLAVVEATKKGNPHLHILARMNYFPQAKLAEWMDELIGSPVVDIQKIDHPGRIAAYVAKYCGKAPHQFGTCKRYWKSRDYEQRPEWKNRADRRTPGDVEKSSLPLLSLYRVWERNGWATEWLADGTLIGRPPRREQNCSPGRFLGGTPC